MARSWSELLGDAEGPDETEEERAGFFGRLRDSLGKSRRALTGELAAATFDPGNDEDWERLEEALIQGDVGVRATAELVRRLEARNELTDLNAALAEKLREHDRSVLLGAADTWRAAAEEQLEIWADRAQADFVGASQGADPAAVAYDAVEAARARGKDVAIVDTAGRLHTQSNLMEELAKVRRGGRGPGPGGPPQGPRRGLAGEAVGRGGGPHAPAPFAPADSRGARGAGVASPAGGGAPRRPGR